MISEELLDNLIEGLYLAGVGMGLVFASLLAFLLVLLVIRRIYPDLDTTSEEEMHQEQLDHRSTLSDVPTSDKVEVMPIGSPDGSKIAAMAVAIYMQMEEEESIGQLVHTKVDALSIQSNWRLDGRNSLMSTQGRRPARYGERSNSDTNNKRGN
tara:strand:+ start:1559 stop:2020 length:462 start_codon:yes stop_codon:yes gene_type:complete